MKRRSPETGFTLVEILMIVIIVGLLASIAIPTYIRARNQAYNSQAKAALTTAFKAARAYYIDHDYAYNIMTAPSYSYIAPNYFVYGAPAFPGESSLNLEDWDVAHIQVVAGPTSNPRTIAAWGGEPRGQFLVMCNSSKGGSSFCIADARSQPLDAGYTAGWGAWSTAVYYSESSTSSTPCGSYPAGSKGAAWDDLWCYRKTKW